MLQTFINMFKIPELRNKLLFTFGLLAIYRIGFAVPLPGVNQEPAEIDQAFVDPFPNLPDGTRELVFHGARVWPYENETISFEDACNTYRFVAELHGMLQAMLKSDKPGQAIKIRHYGKWMRRISDPAADMMFRMASAISQNPQKEFDVKPPPLEVSYGE